MKYCENCCLLFYDKRVDNYNLIVVTLEKVLAHLMPFWCKNSDLATKLVNTITGIDQRKSYERIAKKV